MRELVQFLLAHPTMTNETKASLQSIQATTRRQLRIHGATKLSPPKALVAQDTIIGQILDYWPKETPFLAYPYLANTINDTETASDMQEVWKQILAYSFTLEPNPLALSDTIDFTNAAMFVAYLELLVSKEVSIAQIIASGLLTQDFGIILPLEDALSTTKKLLQDSPALSSLLIYAQSHTANLRGQESLNLLGEPTQAPLVPAAPISIPSYDSRYDADNFDRLYQFAGDDFIIKMLAQSQYVDSTLAFIKPYTAEQYLSLISRIHVSVPDIETRCRILSVIGKQCPSQAASTIAEQNPWLAVLLKPVDYDAATVAELPIKSKQDCHYAHESLQAQHLVEAKNDVYRNIFVYYAKHSPSSCPFSHQINASAAINDWVAELSSELEQQLPLSRQIDIDDFHSFEDAHKALFDTIGFMRRYTVDRATLPHSTSDIQAKYLCQHTAAPDKALQVIIESKYQDYEAAEQASCKRRMLYDALLYTHDKEIQTDILEKIESLYGPSWHTHTIAKYSLTTLAFQAQNKALLDILAKTRQTTPLNMAQEVITQNPQILSELAETPGAVIFFLSHFDPADIGKMLSTVNPKRRTLLHTLVNKPPVVSAILALMPTSKDILQLCIDSGAHYHSIVHHFAMRNTSALMVLLESLNKADKMKASQLKTKHKCTPIHFAAYNAGSLRYLLSFYDTPNERCKALQQQDKKGFTTLMLSVQTNKLPAIKLAINQITSCNGDRTPLFTAIDQNGMNVFHVSADHIMTIKLLLSHCPETARPKVLSQEDFLGEAPVHLYADDYKKLALVSQYIAKDEDFGTLMTHVNGHQQTPLHLAAKSNNTNGIDIIFFRLSDDCKDMLMTMKNDKGNTPLHESTAHPEAMRRLLCHCELVQIKSYLLITNHAGQSTLDIIALDAELQAVLIDIIGEDCYLQLTTSKKPAPQSTPMFELMRPEELVDKPVSRRPSPASLF